MRWVREGVSVRGVVGVRCGMAKLLSCCSAYTKWLPSGVILVGAVRRK